MPQTRLPYFPEDISLINQHIGFVRRGETVFYFNGAMPVFQHAVSDYASFRLYTTQLIVNGNAKQMEIVRAFGVSPSSVKRWVRKYKVRGSEVFFYRSNNANLVY